MLIFLVTYVILATEYRERTIAAMAGASAVWALSILTPDEMISYVDLRAIGLLFGMMVIIGALREGRFFLWLGAHVIRWCRGNPWRLLVAFTMMTAFLSAVLDNVTTVLFMVTVTIDLAKTARFDAKPYILSEIFASNLGGTATLIGDPPNIMIASATGLSFLEFLRNVGPVAAAALAFAVFYFYRRFGRNTKGRTIRLLDVSQTVPERRLMWTGLVILNAAVVLFLLQDVTGIFPTTVALVAAIVLLFIGGPKMPEILKDIEWSTLIFFGSLFIVVGALEKTGWMLIISERIISLIAGDRMLGITVILWTSSLASAFIDNIPFAAAFIPVLTELGRSGMDVYPLWWAFSAGTGLGGNGTIIGASANVIATGIAQARGVRISFGEFAKFGIPMLLITTAIGNLILIVRFLP